MKSIKFMKSLAIFTCTLALSATSIIQPAAASETPESKAYELFTENQEKRTLQQERLMEVVTQYAPEMSEDFTETFAIHEQLHQDLFTARTLQVQAQLSQTKVELEKLKSIKISRQEHDAYVESVKNAVKEYQEQNGNNPDEIKAMHLAFKEAVKAEDAEEIKLLLEDIYSAMQIHLDVDRYRLSLWMVN